MLTKNYVMMNNATNENEELNEDENVLILSHAGGKDFIRIDTIVRCQADDNGCNIYVNNGNKHSTTQTLDEVENKLPKHKFIKIHDADIVNVSFINRHKKNDIDYLILHDGTKLEIGAAYLKNILTSLAVN